MYVKYASIEGFCLVSQIYFDPTAQHILYTGQVCVHMCVVIINALQYYRILKS